MEEQNNNFVKANWIKFLKKANKCRNVSNRMNDISFRLKKFWNRSSRDRPHFPIQKIVSDDMTKTGPLVKISFWLIKGLNREQREKKYIERIMSRFHLKMFFFQHSIEDDIEDTHKKLKKKKIFCLLCWPLWHHEKSFITSFDNI